MMLAEVAAPLSSARMVATLQHGTFPHRRCVQLASSVSIHLLAIGRRTNLTKQRQSPRKRPWVPPLGIDSVSIDVALLPRNSMMLGDVPFTMSLPCSVENSNSRNVAGFVERLGRKKSIVMISKK